MAKRQTKSQTVTPLNPPRASRQITFHEGLLAARKTWLIDALSATLAIVDPQTLKQQLMQFVPHDIQQKLAALGIRDEHVFPTPIVLEVQPTLVGYYRLLTGAGQKSFYRSETGMSPFAKMENQGILLPETQARLAEFCTAMADVIAELVRAISPSLSARDIPELQLLTLGSNFYGGANNAIGAAAMKGVMDAIAAAVNPYIVNQSGKTIEVQTPSCRRFVITRANDPDIRIEEKVQGSILRKLLAIEVKGGSDSANVYNRGGEAEKSHKAAKTKGFLECWTVIHTANPTIDQEKLRGGATHTDAWFDTGQILAQRGNDWDVFQKEILRVMGLL